ncbi:MAG: hypothetical protein N5P05_003587 [Chroococcopsis gigantea SAG 12.99]|nr:hypothetical protein [Chroococcopsis gigantea SAG 12.99]
MPYAKVLLSRIPKVENYVNLSERPQYIEPLDKLIAKMPAFLCTDLLCSKNSRQ